MKIQLRDFLPSISKNLTKLPLLLIYGSNQFLVKAKCDEAIDIICGPSAKDEMRVTKFDENVLLKDPQNFFSQIKTIGFFPGKQVIIIENTTDKIKKAISSALEDWSKDDATIILIANSLKKNSAIRKLVEEHPNSLCLAIFDEQRDLEKIEEIVNSMNIKILDHQIISFLKNPKNFSSHDSFISLIEKIKAFKFQDANPLTFEEVESLLSNSADPSVFNMIDALSDGDIENTIVLLKRLYASGTNPNQIITLLNSHFALLHRISLNIANHELILNTTYPPILGPRRKKIFKQVQKWSTYQIEKAIKIIQKVEEDLRSSPKIELNSALERACLRLVSILKSIY